MSKKIQKNRSKSRQKVKIQNNKSLTRNKTQKTLQIKQSNNNNNHNINRQNSVKNFIDKIQLKQQLLKFNNSQKISKKSIKFINQKTKTKTNKSSEKKKIEQYDLLEKKIIELRNKLERIKKAQNIDQNNKNFLKKYSHSSEKKNCRVIFEEEKKNDDPNYIHNLFNAIVTQQPSYELKSCLSMPILKISKNLRYYISQVCQSFKQNLDTAFSRHLIQSYNTMKYLTTISKKTVVIHNKIKLPTIVNRKTIIFDLDQTLIHCNESTKKSCDKIIKIKLPNNQTIEAGLNIRPYAFQVLQRLSKKYELVLFTASHSCYANVILDQFDPNNQLFITKLFRNHCWLNSQGMYIKDLRVFKNRDLSQIVLVDNAAYSYSNQYQNGIPIIPYYNDLKDTQMLKLERYLDELQFISDVRQKNHEYFKLSNYLQYNNTQDLVNKIYGKSIN